MRNTAGAPGEKNSEPQPQGHKGLNPNQKQLQMHKSQCRMKQQDKCSPSKASSTTKDPNTWVKEELSNNEF
jgi:hypothetical protein